MSMLVPPCGGADEVSEVSGAAGCLGPCGSVVEHSLGKGEVAGPIPAKGTSFSTLFWCFGNLILELKNGKREI
jgi:hypothetical protein